MNTLKSEQVPFTIGQPKPLSRRQAKILRQQASDLNYFNDPKELAASPPGRTRPLDPPIPASTANPLGNRTSRRAARAIARRLAKTQAAGAK